MAFNFDFNAQMALMGPSPPPDDSTKNKELYMTGTKTDLVIECQGRIFDVHRSVVTAGCTFFRVCLEVDMKEKSEGIIRLPDDDPNAVAMLLQYLYTGDYDDSLGPKKEPIDRTQFPARKIRKSAVPRKKFSPKVSPLAPTPGGKKRFVEHVLVWVIADKYLLEELKNLACQKYKQLAIETIAKPAGLNSSSQRRDWNAHGFIDSIRTVYEKTSDENRQLRDIIIAYAYDNRTFLLEIGAFDELMLDFGNFGHEILQMSSRDLFRRHVYAYNFQYIWKCNTLRSCRDKKGFKNCQVCESGRGGFLLPPSGYHDINTPPPAGPQNYQCAEVDCGAVIEGYCFDCDSPDGKFVHVDSLSEQVQKELKERVQTLQRTRHGLDPESPRQ